MNSKKGGLEVDAEEEEERVEREGGEVFLGVVLMFFRGEEERVERGEGGIDLAVLFFLTGSKV